MSRGDYHSPKGNGVDSFGGCSPVLSMWLDPSFRQKAEQVPPVLIPRLGSCKAVCLSLCTLGHSLLAALLPCIVSARSQQ